MRKVTLSRIVASAAAMILFLSCKREVSPPVSPGNASAEKINEWLEQQKKGKSPQKAANIELLKRNLDFSKLWYENSDGDDQYLIIPIKENFKVRTAIDENSVPVLFLVMNRPGTIRRGNVVLFTGKSGHPDKIPAGTFYDIFNTARPACNGHFQFLSVMGTPQYQLEYSNRHISSSGLYQSKEKISGSGRTIVLCYDWYLVTTWYDQFGGITDQTRVYLYTTCGDCGSQKYMTFCADDGGGSNDCCIKDPDAQLTSTVISQTNSDVCGLETKDKFTGLPIKSCTHSWYFRTTSLLWYTWRYGSTEWALELKDAGIWIFRSVSHTGMTVDGTIPPCITSTCNITSALPSYSGNTARVDIIYSITITACIQKIPGGSQSQSNHASSQWIAK